MRIGTSALAALICLVGVGCQNSSTPPSQAMASTQRAIVISGGNTGSGTTIYLPSSDPANPVMLCTSGDATECPECKAAAAKYFSTGQLDPKCSRTGATRTIATGVPANYGHN